VSHNSIHMPGTVKVTGVTPERTFAVGTSNTGFAGTLNLQNNLIRWGQTGSGNPGAILKGAAGTLNSDYNNIHVIGAANTGRIATTSYATLANWQTGTSQDANSGNVDPTATTPGAWTSATDLTFTDFPSTLKGGLPSSIDEDIAGNPRDASRPW